MTVIGFCVTHFQHDMAHREHWRIEQWGTVRSMGGTYTGVIDQDYWSTEGVKYGLYRRIRDLVRV